MNAPNHESSEASLEKPAMGISSSGDLAHQVIPSPGICSQYIYSQDETALRCESSTQPLQLILIAGETTRSATCSALLDSFVSDGEDGNAFIVKGELKSELVDRFNLQTDQKTDQKTHLAHHPASRQNVVITARAFAVDRLNRIISADRKDRAAVNEELASKQAKINPVSYLESLR